VVTVRLPTNNGIVMEPTDFPYRELRAARAGGIRTRPEKGDDFMPFSKGGWSRI
jgi:hypothetical protein